MFRKIISLSLAAMMLSVTSFAGTEILPFAAEGHVEAACNFTIAESTVTSITEADGTEHLQALTAWDGEVATEAPATNADGYYKIEDGADLAWFADYVNNTDATVNAILVNDIDLNGKNWRDHKIGTTAFAGTFDGDGHTIYNFYINATDTDKQGGLFRAVTAGGTVKNLKFKGAKAVSGFTGSNTANTYTSIVCGTLTGGTIENISVSGEITTATDAFANTVGSVVAYVTKGTVQNCVSDVNITLGKGCEYAVASSLDRGIGGIVGVAEASAETTKTIFINNCGFEGSIDAPNSARVGGVIGAIASQKGCQTRYCYNTADIKAKYQVAGVIGWIHDGNNLVTTNSGAHLPKFMYNTGNITATSYETTYAAGVVNGARGSFLTANFYSTGDVTIDDGDASTAEFNGYCALLSTATSKSTTGATGTGSITAFYVPKTYGEGTEKHPLSVAGTGYTKEDCGAAKLFTATDAEFKSGAAGTKAGTSLYLPIEGLNEGYPVFNQATVTATPLTTAGTYYVKDDKLALALDNAGYITLDITPLGTDSSVAVGGKTITAAGTYTVNAAATEDVAVTVTGQALITFDLMNQRAGSALEALEAAAIKAAIDNEESTIVLALFDDTTLEKVVYAANVTEAVIDLVGENVTGKTLKAFVWENDTLAPLSDAPFTLE